MTPKPTISFISEVNIFLLCRYRPIEEAKKHFPENVGDDEEYESDEDEVILNIQQREEQRKKNLERNQNIQSMVEEIENLQWKVQKRYVLNIYF